MRKEGREAAGQRTKPILLTTNQYGGVLCCLGGNRGGKEEEEEVSRESTRVGGLQGGSPGSIIPAKEVL